MTSQQSKLRSYLEAQKVAVRKGPPQTNTTCMLESLLDDSKKKKVKATKSSLAGAKSKRQKTNEKDEGQLTENNSIWSKAVSQNRTQVAAPSSARTLDDLLEPRKHLPCRKRTTSQRTASSSNPLKKLNQRQELEKESKTIELSQVSYSSGSTLPCSLIMKRQGPVRKPKFSDIVKRQETGHFEKKSLSEDNERHSTLQTFPKSSNINELNNGEAVMDDETCEVTGNATKSILLKPDSYLSTSIPRDRNESIVPSPFAMRERNWTQNIEFDRHPQKIAPLNEKVSHTASYDKHKKSRIVNNDNFVRLNMKNAAGSCKGARNLKQQNRMKKRRAEWKQKNNQLGLERSDDDDDDEDNVKYVIPKNTKKSSIQSVVDPIDDFLDGTFHAKITRSSLNETSKECPTCPRHLRPCKLLTVKKNTSGNKGRKFYVCSMPRGEQCDFFQWQDDTIEAAQSELLQSSSHSGFIARQVAGHVDRLKALTLPELRAEAKKRGLTQIGKKQSLLARLSVRVRDEVATALGAPEDDAFEGNMIHDSDDDEGSSEEELVIIGNDDVSKHSDDDSFTSDPKAKNVNRDLENDEIPVDQINVPGCESSLQESLKRIFGYDNFREGQEWAIRRCLQHKKSLLVAPTGQGKSLCYALPATIMEGICIVVSPLVSLMEDQIRHLPPCIPAATLSGNMTTKKMATIIDDIIRNRIKILFVSPERLASAAFRRLLNPKYNPETKSYIRQLPEVSILCVDEAHCLSQWGHNFRVSYLRLRTLVLKLNPRSILALTATAGPPVIEDICHTLGVPLKSRETEDPTEDGTKVLSCNRDNIDVAVEFTSNDEERLAKLLKLLQKKEGSTKLEDSIIERQENVKHHNFLGILSSGSVIVYVWRQKEAEVVTEQLRAYNIAGGVVCYHGGMDAAARSKSQSQFMRGKARICVATVAFGLGINKVDVRGVIHLCLPPSPEHYLQEIGRAGRDGKEAIAIALVIENEFSHKLSLSFSDRLSKAQIMSFLLNLRHLTFKCHEQLQQKNILPMSDMSISVPVGPMVQAVDCKEETIQTILSIFEDDSTACPKLLDIVGIIPDTAIVALKKRSLDKLCEKEDIAKSIQQCGIDLQTNQSAALEPTDYDRFSKYGGTASQKGFLAYSFGIFQISVVTCAQLLGPDAEPRHVFAILRRLQDEGEIEVTFSDSGRSIHLKLNEDGINLLTDPQKSEKWLNEASNSIYNHFISQDKTREEKVIAVNSIMRQVSNVVDDEQEKYPGQKSARLNAFQKLMEEYFSEENNGASHEYINKVERSIVQTVDLQDAHLTASIKSDVTWLLQHPSLKKKIPIVPHSVEFGGVNHKEYTALAITKILHGIETPRAPVLEWYRHPVWGRWRSIHFNSLNEYVQSIV